MNELQFILSILGGLFLLDIIRKVWFKGAEQDKLDEITDGFRNSWSMWFRERYRKSNKQK